MRNILKKVCATVTAAALLAGVSVVPSENVQAASKKVSLQKKAKVTVGKTVKIKLKKNKKKVKWKVTKGKKLIKITKKSKSYAKVKGIKKGTAKLQAVVAKKKYNCTVKVSAAEKKTTDTSQSQVSTSSVPAPQSTPSGNTSVPTAPISTVSPTGNAPTTAEPTVTPSEGATTTAELTVTPSESVPATAKPTVTPTENPEVTPEIRTIVYDGINRDEIYYAEESVAVVVKDGLTSIGDSAFDGCSCLMSIIWKGTTYTSVNDFAKAFDGFK